MSTTPVTRPRDLARSKKLYLTGEQEIFRKRCQDPEKDLYAATTALNAAVQKLMKADSALKMKERRRRILLVDINALLNACWVEVSGSNVDTVRGRSCLICFLVCALMWSFNFSSVVRLLFNYSQMWWSISDYWVNVLTQESIFILHLDSQIVDHFGGIVSVWFQISS